MNPSRRTPLLRGFAGASVATFVALCSHVWGGGAVPGMLGVAVPWVLSLMVCTLLAGRRLSAVRLGLSVALSQALFHSLFVLGEIAPQSGLAPHVHGALVLSSGRAASVVPQDGAMWIAHGIAAVITTITLYRGERILQALLEVATRLAAWLGRALDAAPGHRQAPVSARWTVVAAARRNDPLLACLRRRGPPPRLI